MRKFFFVPLSREPSRQPHLARDALPQFRAVGFSLDVQPETNVPPMRNGRLLPNGRTAELPCSSRSALTLLFTTLAILSLSLLSGFLHPPAAAAATAIHATR